MVRETNDLMDTFCVISNGKSDGIIFRTNILPPPRKDGGIGMICINVYLLLSLPYNYFVSKNKTVKDLPLMIGNARHTLLKLLELY